MFRKITAAIDSLGQVLVLILDALKAHTESLQVGVKGSPVDARVSALEGAVEALKGEMAANVVYADAKLAAGRSAEERARGHLQRAEKSAQLVAALEVSEEEDSFETLARQYTSEHPEPDGAPDNGLSAMPSGLGSREEGRALAKAAKRR